MASSSLSPKGPNYQLRVLLISAGATEGYFEGKMPQRGKVTKRVLFLHTMPRGGFQCLDHPPYSLDLALLDYHLFPGLKKQLKCGHFLSDAEVIAATDNLLNFFLISLHKLELRIVLTLCRSNLNPYCLGRKAAFFQWAFKYTYLPLHFTTLRLAGGISIHYVLLR
jgi:hypothetical protein